VATSTRDSVRDDKGGEANGDVSSVSETDSQGLSCINGFIRGRLAGARTQAS